MIPFIGVLIFVLFFFVQIKRHEPKEKAEEVSVSRLVYYFLFGLVMSSGVTAVEYCIYQSVLSTLLGPSVRLDFLSGIGMLYFCVMAAMTSVAGVLNEFCEINKIGKYHHV